MTLSTAQKKHIKSILADTLRKKFTAYNPEPAAMPFHVRLLGKDRLALYQFIHSLNTNFGTAIFEPVALEIAKPLFKRAQLKYKVGTAISVSAARKIDEIVNRLIAAEDEPNKNQEIESIRHCISPKTEVVKPTVVDFMVVNKNDEVFLFDIKSAKPNQGEFKGFKRTLLQWSAIELTKNPTCKVHTLIAIPYNPYAPEPYNRWTMKGLLDLPAELKVAEEFWDFLGGKGTYQVLLNCFEELGLEMREEIDAYFLKFKNITG